VAGNESASRTHLGKELWVIFSDPTEKAGDRRAVYPQHIAHQYNLEARGILFAAGPFLDETGKPRGPGMIIIRAKDEAEARVIADSDPFHAQGFRTYRLERWRLNEGTFNLRINYSNGTYQID
jgi:uncharacterized protein YciI